jgi:hypothetical protein
MKPRHRTQYPNRNISIVTILVCLSLTLPATLLAGNTLDLTGNPTATPLVAFSLRKLSSAYTGSAIQVRRSSDGTTQNIGFTPAGDLDTATLKTFVGSGTGYVTCWFDQSGNSYNATQGTAAIQPTIMTGGVINRDNGQPSVYTNGGSGFLEYGPVTQLSGTSQVTRMEVCRSRNPNNIAITEGLGNFQLDLQLFPAQIWVQFEDNNITANAAVSNSTSLTSINSVRNNGASQLYVNTVLLGSTASPILTFSAPVIGYVGVRLDYATGGSAGPGAFSETILFSSVLADSDRQAINYNENWYYSLGFAPCSSTHANLSPNGTTTKALYACTLSTWAYYYDPAHPLNLLFGIAKDPGSSGANPSFVADSVNLTTTSNPETSTIAYLSATDGIFALGRYWNVYTHTPLTSSVNIRFFYNPVDTLLIYNAALSYKSTFSLSMMSSLLWFKTVGDPFNYDSLTLTPLPTLKGPYVYLTPVYGTMNGINYAEFDGVASFSGGTGVYIVSNTTVTLPIGISSFSGRCVNNAVQLNWTTQSGANSLVFDIQRSANGSTWEQIGQVSAAGNTSTSMSYSFTDANPLSSPHYNYYRLRMADDNGQDVYSGVVLVNMCDATGATPQPLKVVPNPFGGEIEIICTVPGSAPVEVQLQDMTGATLLRQKFTATKGANVFSLTNLSNLAKGTYVVVVVQEGVVGVGKVIKE